MIDYRIDVIKALKDKGYTTTQIRTEKLVAENTLTYLRKGKPITFESLNKICELLDMQPGEIIRWVPDKKN